MKIYFLNPYGTVHGNSVATVINNCCELLDGIEYKILTFNVEDKEDQKNVIDLYRPGYTAIKLLTFLYNLVPYRIQRALFFKKQQTVRLDFILFNYLSNKYLKQNIRKGDIIFLHGNPIFLNSLNEFREKAKVVLHYHNGSFDIFKSIPLKNITSLTDGIIVLNKKPFEELLDHGYYNTWLINNCIDNNHQKGSQSDSEINFIYSGRAVQDKFILEICQAFIASIGYKHSHKLYITGDFIDKKYEKMIKKTTSPYSNVIFTGKITRKKLFNLLAKTHYIILISELEGSPLSLLEGVINGNKLIASKIPGCEEQIRAFGGYFVNNENPVTELQSIFNTLAGKQHTAHFVPPDESKQVMFSKELFESKFNNVINFYL